MTDTSTEALRERLRTVSDVLTRRGLMEADAIVQEAIAALSPPSEGEPTAEWLERAEQYLLDEARGDRSSPGYHMAEACRRAAAALPLPTPPEGEADA